MVASTEWRDELRFAGRTGSGHAVAFDAALEHADGPSPMEAVLAALCACASVSVVGILRKKRQRLRGLRVEATAEQAPNGVFTRIHLVYKASGPGLDRAAVARAVELSKEKYCSVSLMLAPSVEITASVEVEVEIEIETAP